MPVRVRHPSGLVEEIATREERSAAILAEHGLSAICEILARLRAIEVAISPPGSGEPVSVGGDKHAIELAVERMDADLALVAQRMRGTPP